MLSPRLINCELKSVAICVVFLFLLFVPAKARISFELPITLQRSKKFSGARTVFALGENGAVIGGVDQAVVITNDWSQQPGFQGLRFPLTVDSQGRIICVSYDTNQFLRRYNADGSVDSTFVAPALESAHMTRIKQLVPQADSKVLVGGVFSYRSGLFRLNQNGAIDEEFAAAASAINLLCLPDGKILLNNHAEIHRLLTNGTPDSSFTIIQASTINAFAVQADGKIVIVGGFGSVEGIPMPGIARFFPMAIGISISCQRIDRDWEARSLLRCNWTGGLLQLMALG